MAVNWELDQQRMITKVAWLYHNRQLRQREIAARRARSVSTDESQAWASALVANVTGAATCMPSSHRRA